MLRLWATLCVQTGRPTLLPFLPTSVFCGAIPWSSKIIPLEDPQVLEENDKHKHYPFARTIRIKTGTYPTEYYLPDRGARSDI
jgi:hypothetical protein